MQQSLVFESERMAIQEVQNTKNLVEALLKTKHYQQIGGEGIFAIIQKAKALNISPLEALNGGLYYVQGRVEMSAQMMNQLIRSRGHSIRKDEKSTKELCVLHGKRVDNGDIWHVSFGLEDAKRAGIYRPNSPWEKFPEAMCFARALSMLARQLFSDVIHGCYVEGEICEKLEKEPEPIEEIISSSQAQELEKLIAHDEEYRSKLLEFFKIKDFCELPISHWDRVTLAVKKHLQKRNVLGGSK